MITPKEIYDNAVAHGFHDASPDIPTMLCLIHSEVSEALEGYRKNIAEGEKGCMSEELADVVIRVFDMAYALGIDIEAAIEKKHNFNVNRPYKHGGKRC